MATSVYKYLSLQNPVYYQVFLSTVIKIQFCMKKYEKNFFLTTTEL